MSVRTSKDLVRVYGTGIALGDCHAYKSEESSHFGADSWYIHSAYTCASLTIFPGSRDTKISAYDTY